MATRITVFEVWETPNSKTGFSIKERRCSNCHELIPCYFEFHCPECGEPFDDAMYDYVSKEG